jgi:hypothetical protein
MKKIIPLAGFLISSIAFAQNGPRIDFKDRNNTIDYGTITKENDNGIRSFVFTNTGNAPLIITSTRPLQTALFYLSKMTPFYRVRPLKLT